MLPRSAALVVTLTALSTGCATASAIGAADAVPLPILAVTEQQDDWLHDYCTPKKLVSAVSMADADRQVRASEGNFGEVVYETSSMQIVAFACPGGPAGTVDRRVGSGR